MKINKTTTKTNRKQSLFFFPANQTNFNRNSSPTSHKPDGCGTEVEAMLGEASIELSFLVRPDEGRFGSEVFVEEDSALTPAEDGVVCILPADFFTAGDALFGVVAGLTVTTLRVLILVTDNDFQKGEGFKRWEP